MLRVDFYFFSDTLVVRDTWGFCFLVIGLCKPQAVLRALGNFEGGIGLLVL